MKNLIYIGLTLLCMSCATDPQKEMEKKLLGEWCNPYTYQSTGELKGFRFKKGGVCEGINIPTLDLKTWEIQEGYLIIKGESIEEDGTREEYLTKEKINQLNADSLSLLVTAGPPRIAFLYLNTKVIKDRVTPEK